MKCRHFGSCGSCTIVDTSYEKQVEDKEDYVSKLLEPFYPKSIQVFESLQSHYRARAEFRIWHDGGVCSYAMGNIDKNGAISIDECPKVLKPIEQRMWKLLEKINNSLVLSRKLFGVEFLSTTTGECLVTMLYHRKLDEEWEAEAKGLERDLAIFLIGRSRKQKVMLSQAFVTEKLSIDNRVYIYRQYEGGFTQPNPYVNIQMIAWVLSAIKDDTKRHLLESYCGLGNFTIPLSGGFAKVLATEISKNSIKAAKENCELNSVDNISFVRLSSEEMTQALNKEREFRRLAEIDLDDYDFSHVLVDPPRAGLDDDTINLISQIDTIIYISCKPETLARDLQVLGKTHYVEEAAIFDQFPHTSHVESGVILRKTR